MNDYKAMMESEELSADERIRAAIAAYDAEPEPVMRYLRPGESVAIPEIGLPSARLAGTNIEVAEYPDGTIIAAIPAPARLMDALFVAIVARADGSLSHDELVFVRRHMDFTQSELAERLGVARETVTRMEQGKAPIMKATADAVRLHGVMHILRTMPKDLASDPVHQLDLLIGGATRPRSTDAGSSSVTIPYLDNATVELEGAIA